MNNDQIDELVKTPGNPIDLDTNSVNLHAEQLWNTYFSIQDLIRFSDTKAGAILAFYGIIGSIGIPKIIEYSGIISSQPVIFFLLLIVFALSVFSIYFCIGIFIPQQISENPGSLIFYHSIVEEYKNSYDYVSASIGRISDSKKAIEDLSSQIWSLSQIAEKKYGRVTYAIYLLMCVFIFGIAELLVIICYIPLDLL